MPSLQEALSGAFDKHVSEDGNDQSTGREVTTIDNDTGAIVDESAKSGGELAETTGSLARARAADGKFAKSGSEATVQDDDALPADKQPGAQKAIASPAPSPQPKEQVKAPVSWRPEVRDKFATLPSEVQGEIIRREREVEAGLRTAASHKQFVEHFQHAMQPYAAMITAEGGDYISATTNLMNTAYQLRTAPPPQKAALVAEIVRHFGVDITMLDDALTAQVSGQAGQPAQNDPMMVYVQQQLAPVTQLLQRFTQAEESAKQERGLRVQTEIEQFAADPKNEYFEDVRMDVADLLEITARRGQKMTLQDAYARATMAHPTIGPILATRKLSETAQHRNGAAQRARNASASLASGGAPEQGDQGAAKPKDLNSAIEAAWAKAEQRSD
jgi:hypothetical protein